ncbi:hypothetical protein FACS189430_00280 [Bacteroidia bacterium]|nr:hypothetical protein FACS189430_00280 [Bacteroidia bacterium]
MIIFWRNRLFTLGGTFTRWVKMSPDLGGIFTRWVKVPPDLGGIFTQRVTLTGASTLSGRANKTCQGRLDLTASIHKQVQILNN